MAAAEARIFYGLVQPGVPDILIWHNGKSFGLEIKTEENGSCSRDPDGDAALDARGGYQDRDRSGLDVGVRQLESWGVLRGQTVAA